MIYLMNVNLSISTNMVVGRTWLMYEMESSRKTIRKLPLVNFVSAYTSLESSSERHQRNIMFKLTQEVIYYGSTALPVQNVPPKRIWV